MSYKRYKNSDKSLIFAEYFNDEQSVRRNGGVPTDVTFDKGVAEFNGTTSVINYVKRTIGKTHSIRCILTPNPSGTDVYISGEEDGVENGYLMAIDSNGGIYYSRAQASSGVAAVINERNEIVIVRNADLSVSFYVNGTFISTDVVFTIGNMAFNGFGARDINASADLFAEGDIELLEIYNKVLTAEEVTNLYNDARYVVPNLEHDAQGDGAEKTIDGTFSTDSSWVSEAGWTWDNGSWMCDGTNGARIFQTLSDITLGNRYLMVLEVDDYTSGDIQLEIGSNSENNINVNGAGTYSIILEALSNATGRIESDNFIGSIASISVQPVAVEPTSKILHVTAKDGVCRNLLSGDWNGVELMDEGKGTFEDGTTESFFAYSNNSIENDNGALKIIWVDDSKGAYVNLRDDGDLNTNLVVGSKYRLHVKARRNSGNQGLRVYDGSAFHSFSLTEEYADYIIEFTAASTTGCYYGGENFSSGENIWIDSWRLEEIIPEVTNTDIEVVKEGSVRVPRFNGSTSAINCGRYNSLSKDVSIITWMRPFSEGELGLGVILYNTKLRLAHTTNNRLYIQSDGATALATPIDSIKHNEIHCVAVIRKSTGLADVYIDGIKVIDNTNSGTPADGTSIIIGNNAANGALAWDGTIPEVIVIDGLLTPEEISAYYTSTKHLYNK